MIVQDAENIARHLKLTSEGVLDEGSVLEHSYTTAFYGWLCALLSVHDPAWRDVAFRAVEAELNIMDRWAKRDLSDSPYFHWEFKNMAFLHVEKLLGDHMPLELAQRLHHRLTHWRNLNIDSANWVGMRMVNYQMRRARKRSRLERGLLLATQTPEGFFPDTPKSDSFQYHAYVLALLALYLRQNDKDEQVKQALLRGVRFIADFINPAGDFNYYGRGQRQLFGYAALIFALVEASRFSQQECQQFQALAARVYGYVGQYRKDEGIFPIVLNHERAGWYTYNNNGDYLTFCGVMFMLAAENFVGEIEAPPEPDYARCYTGLAVVSSGDTFAVFAQGNAEDESEPCGLVHLWEKGPLCAGGPDEHKSINGSYDQNYMGPLVNGQPILHQARASFELSDQTLTLQTTTSNITTTQHITLSDNALKLHYHIETDLPVQLATLAQAFDLQPTTKDTVLSPAGYIPRYISDRHPHITLAKINTLQWENRKAKPKKKKNLLFIWKSIWVLWVMWERS